MKRDPWDFSDRIDGHIEGSANYNMLKEESERLRKERDDANKIASDAKFEIDRLVAEVHRLRDEARQFAETCICPACKRCQ